ncbi:MAG: DMT family transporter [Opitutales bacterium]
MLGATLTSVFFALSITLAQRSLKELGQMRANLGRLLVAALALGIYAHTAGTGFRSVSTGWLLFSGVVGMGLGDLALFHALPRLGSRLSLLMTQCLAAPIAAVCEWLWLGTRLTGAQVAWSAVILGGVAFALMPDRAHPPRVTVRGSGFVLGLFSAAGQGLGAIITRKGNLVSLAAGAGPLDGINAAYHRILGGLAVTVLWFGLWHWLRPAPAAAAPAAIDSSPLAPRRSRYLWVVGNGLAGPVIGVSCYQWALTTMPSGVVLPIVATSPLVAIPLIWAIEGDRPTTRSVLGGIVAVAGVVGLALCA